MSFNLVYFHMVDFCHKKLCLKISPCNIKIPLANQWSDSLFLYFPPKILLLFALRLNIFHFPALYIWKWWLKYISFKLTAFTVPRMLKYHESPENLKISVEDNKPDRNVDFLFHWLLTYCTFHRLRNGVSYCWSRYLLSPVVLYLVCMSRKRPIYMCPRKYIFGHRWSK